MRLTVYTDYSLRVLMYVAAHPGRLPTIGEIAAAYGVSKNHLMKVVHQLGSAGYLETVRGKNGGLRLARPAAEIGIGEVVRHAEPDMAMAPCFPGASGFCRIAPGCGLRSVLHEATDAFLGVLDGYTLADVVENRDGLSRLFDLAATTPR